MRELGGRFSIWALWKRRVNGGSTVARGFISFERAEAWHGSSFFFFFFWRGLVYRLERDG